MKQQQKKKQRKLTFPIYTVSRAISKWRSDKEMLECKRIEIDSLIGNTTDR